MFGLHVTPNTVQHQGAKSRNTPNPATGLGRPQAFQPQPFNNRPIHSPRTFRHGNPSFPELIVDVGFTLLGELIKTATKLKSDPGPLRSDTMVQTKMRVIDNLKFRIEYIDILYKLDISNAIILPKKNGTLIDSKILVDITIENETLRSFSSESEEELLEDLKDHLKLSEIPEVVNRRKGSVILTIAIVVGALGTLVLLNKYGKFRSRHAISSISLAEKKRKRRNKKLIDRFKNEIGNHLIEILTDIVRFINPNSKQRKNEAVLALARANRINKIQSKNIIDPKVLFTEENMLWELILRILDGLKHSDVNDEEALELEKKYLESTDLEET